MKRRTVLAGWILAGGLAAAGAAGAERMVFTPRVTTTQWRTALPEAPVQEIHVYARRASGSDTFFNLRFGREGHSFDGRRVYLRGGDPVRASWDLHGRKPGGKELILNAYNGSVHVERVEVVLQGDARRDARPGRGRTGAPHGGYGDDRYGYDGGGYGYDGGGYGYDGDRYGHGPAYPGGRPDRGDRCPCCGQLLPGRYPGIPRPW